MYRGWRNDTIWGIDEKDTCGLFYFDHHECTMLHLFMDVHTPRLPPFFSQWACTRGYRGAGMKGKNNRGKETAQKVQTTKVVFQRQHNGPQRSIHNMCCTQNTHSTNNWVEARGRGVSFIEIGGIGRNRWFYCIGYPKKPTKVLDFGICLVGTTDGHAHDLDALFACDLFVDCLLVDVS